jgi:hypothetical protein
LDKTPAELHASKAWMKRLKRVFNIDIEICERCAGQVKIIVEASTQRPCATPTGSSFRLNPECSHFFAASFLDAAGFLLA